MRRLLQILLGVFVTAYALTPSAGSQNWIQGWYEAYNAQYFEGKLPANVRVEVRFAGKENVGLTYSCDSPSRLCIKIDPWLNPEGRSRRVTLLHEMIHVKLNLIQGDGIDSHGPLFMKELHRLMDAGAFDELL